MSEYKKLTALVNQKLVKKLHQKIIFEEQNNLDENLHAFPIEKLMCISDNEIFIYEIYYKLLNRMIDLPRKNELLSMLEKGDERVRINILKDIYNSQERKYKNTELVFTKEYSL